MKDAAIVRAQTTRQHVLLANPDTHSTRQLAHVALAAQNARTVLLPTTILNVLLADLHSILTQQPAPIALQCVVIAASPQTEASGAVTALLKPLGTSPHKNVTTVLKAAPTVLVLQILLPVRPARMATHLAAPHARPVIQSVLFAQCQAATSIAQLVLRALI